MARDELCAAEAREHGKLRHLRDCTDAYHTDPQRWLHGVDTFVVFGLLRWNIPPTRTVPKRRVPSTV